MGFSRQYRISPKRSKRHTKDYALVRTDNAFKMNAVVCRETGQISKPFEMNELYLTLRHWAVCKKKYFDILCGLVLKSGQTDIENIIQLARDEGHEIDLQPFPEWEKKYPIFTTLNYFKND